MKKLIYIAIFLQLSISSLLLAGPDDTVSFADPNLAEAVAEALDLTLPITESEMANLRSLTANSMGISDLTGLQYAPDVNELHLSGNLISDLSPISALTSLIYLYLNDNQITDISVVSSMVNLDTLFLSINLINDLSPVSGLTGLTELYLGSNQIASISSLSGLSNLAILDLTNNQVVDISTVSDLTRLEQLYLTDNDVVNTPTMSNLTSLQYLYLANNDINDISTVSDLTSLQYLHLTNNQISDISSLTGGEPNDLITLLLSQNPLDDDAYCIHLPIIINNNPELTMLTYDTSTNPCSEASDTCESAVIIFKDVPYEYSTVGATGTEESLCGVDDLYDVWHSYTPDSNEVVDISLCGSSLDTTLTVLDSCDGTVLACNDDHYCDFSPSVQSLVTVDLTAGATYLIRVAGYDKARGSYDLIITDAPEPPANNTCQDAIEIVQYTPVTGSTTTAYGTDITSCTVSDTRDVWYYFIPTISGRYMMDLDDSDFDTSLALFDDCGGTELACNDNYCNYDGNGRCYVPKSRIVVSMVEGETYYIRVSGYSGGGGTYNLTVTLAADISKNGRVNIFDLSRLVQEWLQDGISYADIDTREADDGGGDKFIGLLDFAEISAQWDVSPL